MLYIEATVAQVTLSGAQALEIARARFPYLGAGGFLPRKVAPQPIDPGEIETAMMFLRQCRRTKTPRVHSHDLRRLIGVRLGAVIAAATALGFGVHSWFGTKTFAPHVLIAVNGADAARIAAASRSPSTI
jgi:hypothetical protein